jgi:phosphatidate cytidylyltransferase
VSDPRTPSARAGLVYRAGGSDVGSRTLFALPLIALALFLVIEGGPIFVVGVFALGCICLHELYAMYERVSPVRLAGFLALAGLLLAALYGSPTHPSQVLLVATAALPLLFGLTLLQRHPSVAGMALTLLGIYWIGFGLAHAVLLRQLPHGEGIVIDVLVGTFLGDTGAYLGGRLFGRHPLALRISPKKTVEGLVIGMACAVLSVWFAGRYQDWLPGSHALVLGLGVALFAPIGDLFESFVKRQAGTKDAGHLLGAHGGVLDRLDAILFTAVVGYYIWLAYV